MIMKKENPAFKKRHKLLRAFSRMDLSYHTRASMVTPMLNKSESEKEEIAEVLMGIIESSTSEEEMIQKTEEIYGELTL